MNLLRTFRLSSFVALIAAIWLSVPWESDHFIASPVSSEMIIWLTVFVLFAFTVFSKNKLTIDHVAQLVLGVLYVGYGFHYMLSTRLMDHGLFYSFLLFACIWLTDSGAYFVGSRLGKHLLWPVISPKKSIEGAIGGIVLSIVTAVIFAVCQPELLSYPRAVIIGLVIAVVGQLGDLIQSAYKRVKGIKDTGALLPGHGGVLDRVDSWLIVFPIVYWLGLLS
jgi:phosphatidate cytidylyltransferase